MGQKRTGRHGLSRRIAAALLTGALSAALCADAWAIVEGPQEPADVGKTTAELNGYSEEQWASLMDDMLEYGEINELVHNFNPTISNIWKSYNTSVDDLLRITNELKGGRRDMENRKEAALAEMDYASYGNYYMQEIIFRKSYTALADSAKTLQREVNPSNRELRVAEEQVSAGVKLLMIGYSSLMENRAIVAESVEMYRKAAADASARAAVGQATAADVTSAEVDRMQAENQLASLDVSARQLKDQLIIMCGWKAGSDPVIGPVPAPDLSRIAAMDPGTDLAKAIGNNYTLITFRHASHDKGTYALDTRFGTEEAMEAQLKINLEKLYQDVLTAKADLDAAQTGMQAAEMTKNAAEVQYGLGMISMTQYLGMITGWTSAKAQLSSASYALFQAMESYDWAVAGNLSLD